MSSHPGATMNDAVEMALWLKKWGYSPEQVQDFYPTPGTISTVMYYTGIDPMTGKSVYVCTDYREKQLQRALLQFSRPENSNLVREALRAAGREDLIGYGDECLVRPAFGQGKGAGAKSVQQDRKRSQLSNRREHSQKRTTASVRKSSAGHSKLERTFGADAIRIMREADRMTGGSKNAKSKPKTTSAKKKQR